MKRPHADSIAAALAIAGLIGIAVASRGARRTQPAPPVDCIRLISAETSAYTDTAVAELVRVGFEEAAISVQVEKLDPISHKRGCFEAHRRAHAAAVEMGCRYTLVAEDDIVFPDSVAAAWAAAERFFRIKEYGSWDALFLGYTAVRIDDAPDYRGIARIQKPMLSHGVIFPIETSRRIAALPEWEPQKNSRLSILEAYDVALWHSGTLSPTATYGLYPPLAGQRGSQKSSLSLDKNRIVDYGKSVAGLKRLAWFSHGRCAKAWAAGGSAGVILWKAGLIDSVDDWLGVSKMFDCKDVLDLSAHGSTVN